MFIFFIGEQYVDMICNLTRISYILFHCTPLHVLTFNRAKRYITTSTMHMGIYFQHAGRINLSILMSAICCVFRERNMETRRRVPMIYKDRYELDLTIV